MMCSARDSSYSRWPTSLKRSYLLVPMRVPLVDQVMRGEAVRAHADTGDVSGTRAARHARRCWRLGRTRRRAEAESAWSLTAIEAHGRRSFLTRMSLRG